MMGLQVSAREVSLTEAEAAVSGLQEKAQALAAAEQAAEEKVIDTPCSVGG